MKIYLHCLLWLSVFGGLAGCTTRAVTPMPTTTVVEHDSLDTHLDQLASSLFKQISSRNTLTYSAPRIAVSSFLPVSSLSLADAADTEKQLANQLSESMLTHARQYGFAVYDYRLRQQILLNTDHEQALSRQLADIGNSSDADTLLVGTYTSLEDGVMLNVRLIAVADKKVLAASSGFIPRNVLWGQQNVGKRGGKLYRQNVTGEPQ